MIDILPFLNIEDEPETKVSLTTNEIKEPLKNATDSAESHKVKKEPVMTSRANKSWVDKKFNAYNKLCKKTYDTHIINDVMSKMENGKFGKKISFIAFRILSIHEY